MNAEAPTGIGFKEVYSTANLLFSSIEKKFFLYPERVVIDENDPSVELLPMTHRNDSFESKYSLIRVSRESGIGNYETQYDYGLFFEGPDINRLFISSQDKILRVKTEKMNSKSGVNVPEAVEKRLVKMVKGSRLPKKKDYSPPELAFAA